MSQTLRWVIGRGAAMAAGAAVSLPLLYPRLIATQDPWWQLPLTALFTALGLLGGFALLEASLWAYKKLKSRERAPVPARRAASVSPAPRQYSPPAVRESGLRRPSQNPPPPAASEVYHTPPKTENVTRRSRTPLGAFGAPARLVGLAVVVAALSAAGVVVYKNFGPSGGAVVAGANTNAGNSEAEREAKAAKAVEHSIERKPAALRSALRQYAETSGDIRRILAEGLEEEKNVGGAVAVAINNFLKNGDRAVEQPEALDFRRITEPKALVNRVLDGIVSIEPAIVTPLDDMSFEIVIKLRNEKEFPVEYVIPKGQIIEMKDGRNGESKQITVGQGPEKHPQNGATSQEKGGPKHMLAPLGSDTITLIGYCMSPTNPVPQGKANLTIFALGVEFDTREGLRDTMHRRLKLGAAPASARRSHDEAAPRDLSSATPARPRVRPRAIGRA